eukprot:SAG22_NODE_907_length_6555_cov_19.560099_6_plen_342_part_00
MAASSLDQAQNQALRFASALRWERGARKQVEDENGKLKKEVEDARALNKTLTGELQATSSLLRGAAQTAELLQKNKAQVASLEKQLAAQDQKNEDLRSRLEAGSGSLPAGDAAAAELQKQRLANDQLRQVNLKLRDTIGNLTRGGNSPPGRVLSRNPDSPGVRIKSPYGDTDPNELMMMDRRMAASRAGDGPTAVLFGEPDGSEPDPYDLARPPPSPHQPQRQPLGRLNGNSAAAGSPRRRNAKAAKQSPIRNAEACGVACLQCHATMMADDAGNLQCFECRDQQMYGSADVIDMPMDGDGDGTQGRGGGGSGELAVDWRDEDESVLQLHLGPLDADQIDR